MCVVNVECDGNIKAEQEYATTEYKECTDAEHEEQTMDEHREHIHTTPKRQKQAQGQANEQTKVQSSRHSGAKSDEKIHTQPQKPAVYNQEEHQGVQPQEQMKLQEQYLQAPMPAQPQAHVHSETGYLQKSIAYNCTYLSAKHDEKVEVLKASLAKLQSTKKFLSISEHIRVSKERKVLSAKLDECEQQKKEFVDYCHSQMEELSSVLDSTPNQRSLWDTIQRLRSKFDRECHHFEAALPIYAKRTSIVQTICSHQVTILVGETGSGKSTQVVQYLYDAGIARNGLIVCTQPRKVAAITLAKHVSGEMNVNLGRELGYRVGMNAKCSNHTKVLYMTDHVILNECIADRHLSKYSCLVIDEAHERSINTDMLLAFIKQCLPSRRDLKVVIMSATIDPQLFVSYFKQDNTSVTTIMVSGRTYPVGVVYDPLNTNMKSLNPDNQYVMNAVEMAKKIHTTEPPGDILVFLTCAPEIERACRAMEHLNATAEVLPLHGKLPPEEQQKVFKVDGKKRKVIFSTNVAETSVTIPGVKYVVDTGLAKEMQFDPKKNMDSLEVRLISKSSAEQRKGRAGRTNAGKCYRLYTLDEYDSDMSERSKPEILRIQLAQVVLKLFEFGVPNVLTFDFVEHPDRVALEAAVETLQFVGAIQDGALTGLGKKMAALPLNPLLAKVLLDGIDAGVGTEALCAVALSSLSGQVFFRGSTDEMKQASDKMKLQFCHTMGDQMTNLSVYQCWLAQKKGKRNQWCVDNYVNAKSMRIVEETVKELGHILKHRLHLTVNLQLESLHAAECHIPKLFFEAFLSNLAVYLGHECAGYLSSETNGTFVIFPGSSLKKLNSTPKYVLYERTLKTSQQFITQVMDVKQSWVEEAVKCGRLSQDPAERFRSHMVTPLHVVSVGPCTYNKSISKRSSAKEIKENIIMSCSQPLVSPVLDLSLVPKQWGIVRVFASQHHHSVVQLVIAQYISQMLEKLNKESREYGITKDDDEVRVVIGSGGTIQEVMMPYHFRTVVAQGPHDGKWIEEVKCLLAKYGDMVKQNSKQFDADYRLFVTYQNPADAQRAVSECKYPEVAIRPWKTEQFTLKVEWRRRERGNFAFISFDCPMHVLVAHDRLRWGMIIFGHAVKVRLDRNGEKKLFLSGRNMQTLNENHLREKIDAMLGGTVPFRLTMGYLRCETSDEQYEAYEQELMDIIAEHVDPGTYSVTFPKPEPRYTHFQAYINFDSPEEGYKALNSGLNEEFIGENKRLHVTANLKSRLLFRKQIFDLIQASLEEHQSHLLYRYPTGLRIKINKPNKQNKEFASIIINCDDVHTFAVAQNVMNSVAQPHVVECKTPELQQYILSSAYREQLEAIQAKTCTYIWTDRRAMCVKVYGTEENRTKAIEEIERGADVLFSGGAKQIQLEVGGSKQPPRLMKCLVSRYGSELEGMLQIEGVRVVTLNPHRQVISLLATSQGQEAVKKVIEEYLAPTQAEVRQTEFEVECSVCLTQIETPEELIRLECCGHAYHICCIELQLKPNTIVFPVQCASEGCSKNFVWQDFENLQKKCNFRIRELISASLKDHLDRHGDKYKNCPTPNCGMVYTITETGKPFFCSHCGVATCTKCHEQYHSGLSCEMYKAGKHGEEEFKQWIENDSANRKTCPKCSAPIEKAGGCNHVLCRCKAHICWMCLKYFHTSAQCYAHQPFCRNQCDINYRYSVVCYVCICMILLLCFITMYGLYD